ncbi:MAG: SpaA isopeptide-forming pilin-related protein [Eubacteriales bacterium]|nr:SpaA isopeptide-forming pilin-related protein [Eubacteriales bacterium]
MPGKRFICGLVCMLTVLWSAFPVMAASQNPSVILPGKTGTIHIVYKENDGKTSVKGAEFTCYQIGDIQTQTEEDADGTVHVRNVITPIIEGVVIDDQPVQEEMLKAVQNAYAQGTAGGDTYSGSTDSKGILLLKNVRQGIYLVAETKAADGYFVSKPFVVSVPFSDRSTAEGANDYWNYTVTCEPKPLAAGEWKIRKSVKGNAGEKNREFHFQIKIEADGEFQYKKSDGTEGKVSNDAVITLKDGQDIQIMMLPAGTAFSVTEQEAGKEGYTTTFNGAAGHISGQKTAETTFINTRDRVAADTPAPSSNSQGGKEASGKVAPVKTGDAFHAVLYAALFLCGMTGLLWALRKKGEDVYDK